MVDPPHLSCLEIARMSPVCGGGQHSLDSDCTVD